MSGMAATAIVGSWCRCWAPNRGVGTDAESVFDLVANAVEHWSVPTTRRTTGEVFAGLAGTWREERGFASSPYDLATHWAYQRIIGIGPSVVPHILRELESRPDHWFWALEALTGADPVPIEQRGIIKEMTAAWLRWGRERDLVD